jgi:hypothetical protein
MGESGEGCQIAAWLVFSALVGVLRRGGVVKVTRGVSICAISTVDRVKATWAVPVCAISTADRVGVEQVAIIVQASNNEKKFQ